MPLVAFALLAYGAGLLAGLAGALGAGALGAAGAALAALIRRSGALAAVSALVLAGLAMGRAVERRDHSCAMRIAGRVEWTVVAATALSPGETAEVTVRDGRCAVRAWASIVSGRAAAGSSAIVRGIPRVDRRGLALGNVRVLSSSASAAMLVRWRDAATRSIDASFGSDAPVARALLVADMRTIPREMRDDFAAAGLVHMLSISGLHVGLIALAVTTALGALGLPRTGAGWGSVALTALYVAMIGAPAPAVRAIAMLAAGAIVCDPNPTQVVTPRRVCWKLITMPRIIGYQENRTKQKTAPVRNA